MNVAVFRKPLILMVDDAPEVLSLVNDALERADMTTLVALEGEQALRIARRMAPDAILLDALMPHMDGFAVCRALRADPELRDIPVIFMTGLGDGADVVRGFDAGGSDYLTKPLDPLALAARIRVHTQRARAALSARSALDRAGHNLIALDERGTLLWSTPQAAQLLDQAGGAAPRTALARWLAREPGEGASLRLTESGPLRAVYLGRAATGERLVRAVNDDHPDELATLRRELGLTAREAEVLL